MAADLVLAALLGTWQCTSGGEVPNMKAAYSFRRDSTGTLLWLNPPSKQNFTFTIQNGAVIERGSDGLRELHDIKVRGRSLIDESNVYWHEGRWTPVPMNRILICRR
jgi:hypothetical protein